MATNSRSVDRRANATSSPTSTDIGIVSASADGTSVSIALATTVGETPLAMNASACSMSPGISRTNVKTSSASSIGGSNCRRTYRSIMLMGPRPL